MAQDSHIEDDEPDDISLMLRVKEGDESAFRGLVDRHQQPLRNFFFRLGVAREADDLAQLTFLRLYKYRDRYEPKAKFTTFLYMMARQIRIDFLRKLQRQAKLREGFGDHLEVCAQTGSGDVRLQSKAEEALRELPEKMRLVVVMSIYQDLKYEEISGILEIPIGTVKSRMFQALRRMREKMNDG